MALPMQNGPDMRNAEKTDIIISGGGLIARLMALALARSGFRLVLIAPDAGHSRPDPRSYALAPSSLRLIERLGVSIDPQMIAPARRVELSFGAQLSTRPIIIEEGQDTLMALVDHPHLERAIDDALEALPGTCKPGRIAAMAGKVEIGEFSARLPDRELAAPLFLIAEGAGSKTARGLGIGYNSHDYKQLAITARLGAERPHEGVARQIFLPAGPLALLPATDNARGAAAHTLSMVWSQEQKQGEALLALSDHEFCAALEAICGDVYGKFSLATPRAHFPLYHSRPSRLVGERFALIGDSAHGIHPLAGQGLNLGIRDVACLRDCLIEARGRGEDIGCDAVLARFANWRKGDISRLTHLTRGLDQGLRGNGPIKRALGALSPLANAAPIKGWLAEMSDPSLGHEPLLLKSK